jgi:hypothetical protein
MIIRNNGPLLNKLLMLLFMLLPLSSMVAICLLGREDDGTREIHWVGEAFFLVSLERLRHDGARRQA